jgi:hypothetical protein
MSKAKCRVIAHEVMEYEEAVLRNEIAFLRYLHDYSGERALAYAEAIR